MNVTSTTLTCFFCHRDLSMAMSVTYVAEGPICSMCLHNLQTTPSPNIPPGTKNRCSLCHGTGIMPEALDVEEYYED